MGVPVFRLPFLALKVVVDHFNRVELVTVSLMSKRADRVLKICGKKNESFFNLRFSKIRDLRDFHRLELFLLEYKRQGKLPLWHFKLYCSVSFELHISIRCLFFNITIYIKTVENIEKFGGIIRNLKIGESLVPVVLIKDSEGVERIHTILNSNTDGLATIFEYFKNNFNLPIEHLNLSGKDTKAMRTVVNHINSTQTVVKRVQVDFYPPLSGDDFQFILENVSATESFVSYSELNQNYKFDGTIRDRNINIENGHWFTLRNLLMCNESEVIHVNGSDYTKEELRRFLREWKAGKLPTLRKVVLATKVSYLDVTRGFERRREKCDYSSRRRPVVAIKGQSDFYGIVDPNENGYGYFHMSVHND